MMRALDIWRVHLQSLYLLVYDDDEMDDLIARLDTIEVTL